MDLHTLTSVLTVYFILNWPDPSILSFTLAGPVIHVCFDWYISILILKWLCNNWFHAPKFGSFFKIYLGLILAVFVLTFSWKHPESSSYKLFGFSFLLHGNG